MPKQANNTDYAQLAQQITHWSRELGFQQQGISDIRLSQAEERLMDWLKKGFHGDMDYMQKHGTKRSRPDRLRCRSSKPAAADFCA